MSNVKETPDIQGVMVMTFILMATTTSLVVITILVMIFTTIWVATTTTIQVATSTFLVALFSFNYSLTNKEAPNRSSLLGVFLVQDLLGDDVY